MSATNIPANENFTGSIPDSYDRFLGAAFFAPFATDLAERAAMLAPARVLEFAAGTGIVTQSLAETLPHASLLATDLNEPMLARARQKAGHFPNVKFQIANAQGTDLPGGDFDLIVHQFGVMFFPDRAAHYREARRLLTPGGHLLFNTYDALHTNDCPDIAEQTFLKLYPDNPLRFIGKVPHGYFDNDKITGELKSAGFVTVKIDTIEKRCLAPDANTIAQGLCLGTPLRGEILARDPDGLVRAVEAVRKAIATRLGDGPIDACMQAHVVTAS